MKFLLIFSILLFYSPAFSNDFSGTTWALSGVGCRDSSMSRSSHASESPRSDLQDVVAGTFRFLDDRNVEMTATMRGREQTQRGTYRVGRNEIEIDGAKMSLLIERNELIIRGSGREAFEICCGESTQEEYQEERYKECKEENPFVYVLEQV